MDNLFGARMRFYRKNYRITQEKMAVRLGVSASTVRNWESGRVKVTEPIAIAGIASILDVNQKWLMGEGDIRQILVGENPHGKSGEDPVAHILQYDVIEGVTEEQFNVTYYHETAIEGPMFKEEVIPNAPLVELERPKLNLITLRQERDEKGNVVRESGEFVKVFRVRQGVQKE